MQDAAGEADGLAAPPDTNPRRVWLDWRLRAFFWKGGGGVIFQE
jgi:hypothetical protein